MRPDTPLCESLRPRRRRLQLPGRCPSLRPGRPHLAHSPRAWTARRSRAWAGREEDARGRDEPRPRPPPPRATAPVGSLAAPPACLLAPDVPSPDPEQHRRDRTSEPPGRRGGDGRGRAPRQAPSLKATGLGALLPLGRFFPARSYSRPWSLSAPALPFHPHSLLGRGLP